jgi:hypothetical protein
MFWFILAFMAIGGYAVLTIGIDRTPHDIESGDEKIQQP